ncbi:MAG TPA: hypothetical protein VIK39_11275, partial [Candidatus Angelobacter sp.]
MMRKLATFVVFVLLAVATAVAQNPAGTNNTGATTPQTQSSSNPSNGTAPTAVTSSSEMRQAGTTPPVSSGPGT